MACDISPVAMFFFEFLEFFCQHSNFCYFDLYTFTLIHIGHRFANFVHIFLVCVAFRLNLVFKFGDFVQRRVKSRAGEPLICGERGEGGKSGSVNVQKFCPCHLHHRPHFHNCHHAHDRQNHHHIHYPSSPLPGKRTRGVAVKSFHLSGTLASVANFGTQ